MPVTDDGLIAFQRRIARTPLLTAREELELARRIERGDAEAKRRMIEANLRLVVFLARRLYREDGRVSLMDLVQDGTFGLMRAVEKFDHRRGLRFSTYARRWIRYSIQRGFDERRAAPPPASLDAAMGDDGDVTLGELLRDESTPPPDALFARAERDDDVTRLLGRLRPLDRRVLELRYGLGDSEALPATEAARALGTTPSKLRLAEDRALRRLRALPDSARLREAAHPRKLG